MTKRKSTKGQTEAVNQRKDRDNIEVVANSLDLISNFKYVID
jgi:hypothetical protein